MGGGGGKVRHQNFQGVWRDTAATPAKRYRIQEISCDTCSATGGPHNSVQLSFTCPHLHTCKEDPFPESIDINLICEAVVFDTLAVLRKVAGVEPPGTKALVAYMGL